MKLNIAVIFGGRSVEHEISVLSAQQCINAIDKDKYQITPIYISKEGVWYTGEKLTGIENFRDLDALLSQCEKIYLAQNAGEHVLVKAKSKIFGKKVIGKIDVAFPVMHGTYGEDGALQGLLEVMNIPYVGCDVLASGITMDKIVTKKLLQILNVPVLDYVWFSSEEWINNKEAALARIQAKFTYPLIVKPNNLGSSVGVTAVETQAELEDAIDLAVSMSQRVLVEPKIQNLREINCAMLGDHEEAEVSVCEEPIRGEAILSYQDKYLSGNKAKGAREGAKNAGMSSMQRKIPADIPEEKAKAIQEIAKKVFLDFNCSGVVRADFLFDVAKDQVFLCELNPIPGSLSFYLWEASGINFASLTDRLINLALKRHRENNNLIVSYATNILRDYRASGKNGAKS